MAVYTTINDGGSFFNPKLWVGSTSSNVITGVGFQPDLLWIKDRDSTAYNVLTDAVRGTDSQIYSNSSSAEGTLSTVVTSFDSDGFTISGSYPNDGDDYITWCWKAGTTTGIAGSPSITPNSYSFNATSGFSIIEYTGNAVAGATLPHGLGTADIGMIIIKSSSNSTSWPTYSKGLGATKYMFLDQTDAVTTSDSMFNDTEPTSTLFSLGSMSYANGSSYVLIAYVFANIQGYSRGGSFTGNGNVDGTFVYTGFRPSFVMLKATSISAESWSIFDNTRPSSAFTTPSNFVNKRLSPNYVGGAEVNYPDATSGTFDFCANGFKLRAANAAMNSDGTNYIYMAFAESPFVNSSGVPSNAR
jgi:hypothetical protein